MKTINNDKLVTLGHFVGFRFEKLSDDSMALVRTNAPIIQTPENQELSDNATNTIKAIYDRAVGFEGDHNDIDGRVKEMEKAMNNFDHPLWSHVRAILPNESFETHKNEYLKSIDKLINHSLKNIEAYIKDHPEHKDFYANTFDDYSRITGKTLEGADERV